MPPKRDFLTWSMIQQAAAREGVDPLDIEAIVQQESSGNARAQGPAIPKAGGARAQGLMQLMPATARDLGVTDPMDAAQNINAGTRYYGQLLRRYGGDKNKALAAYNWGMGNVDKLGMDAMPAETRNYVTQVPQRAAAAGQAQGATAAPDDLDAFLNEHAKVPDDLDAFLDAKATPAGDPQTRDTRPGGGIGTPRDPHDPLSTPNQKTRTTEQFRDMGAKDEHGNVLSKTDIIGKDGKLIRKNSGGRDESAERGEMLGGMGDRLNELFGDNIRNSIAATQSIEPMKTPGVMSISQAYDMAKGLLWDTPKAIAGAVQQAQSPEGIEPREAGKRIVDTAQYLPMAKPAARVIESPIGQAAARVGVGAVLGNATGLGSTAGGVLGGLLDRRLFGGRTTATAAGETAEQAAARKAATEAANQQKYDTRRADRKTDFQERVDIKAKADEAARVEREQIRARADAARQAKEAANAKAAQDAAAKAQQTQAERAARQAAQEKAAADAQAKAQAAEKARADRLAAERAAREKERAAVEQQRQQRAARDAEQKRQADAQAEQKRQAQRAQQAEEARQAEAQRQAQRAADEKAASEARARREAEIRTATDQRAAQKEAIIRRQAEVRAQAAAEARAKYGRQGKPQTPSKTPEAPKTGAETPGKAQPTDVDLSIKSDRAQAAAAQTPPQAPSQQPQAPPKRPSRTAGGKNTTKSPTYSDNDLAAVEKEFGPGSLAELRQKFGAAVDEHMFKARAERSSGYRAAGGKK